MWGNLLGSKPPDEKELEKINPQIALNLRKLKPQDRYWRKRDLWGLNPQDIDEDEDAQIACNSLFNRIGQTKTRIEKDGSQSLTPHGWLEKEVSIEVKNLSKKGFTRKGRERVKDKCILYQIHDFAWDNEDYSEIRWGILNNFTENENEKIQQGTIHILKCRGDDIHPFLYDKRIFDFYDFTKWRKCYKERFNCTVETLEEAFDHEIYGKYKEIENKIELYEKGRKETQKQKEIRLSHICVLSYIYAINCVEKIIGVDFLKSDLELRKIWGIQRDTYRRKMELLSSIDMTF